MVHFRKSTHFGTHPHLRNAIVLRRKLITSGKSHTCSQVQTIYEDETPKLCNAALSSPEEKIVENIKNTKSETIKGAHFKKKISQSNSFQT